MLQAGIPDEEWASSTAPGERGNACLDPGSLSKAFLRTDPPVACQASSHAVLKTPFRQPTLLGVQFQRNYEMIHEELRI